jgi:hypothetical protein
MEVGNNDWDYEYLDAPTGIHLWNLQLRGMLYRRILVFKRTPGIRTRMMVTYLIGLGVSILLALLVTRDQLEPTPVIFRDLPGRQSVPHFAGVVPSDLPVDWKTRATKVTENLRRRLEPELEEAPTAHLFGSTKEFNDWTYQREKEGNLYLALGLDLTNEQILIATNRSSRESDEMMTTLLLEVYQAVWGADGFGKLEIRHGSLNRNLTAARPNIAKISRTRLRFAFEMSPESSRTTNHCR